MSVEGVDAFPLTWPDGWERTSSPSDSRYQVIVVDRVRQDVLHSLRQMNVFRKDIVISTNLPLRRDGEPYGDARCQGSTGVAVYWMRKTKPQVMACDRWKKVGENLRAIWQALEALRSLERCGASQVIERAFMGFAALPAANRSKPWREVLGFPLDAFVTPGHVTEAYRELARIHHPDRGGDQQRMSEINVAVAEATDELKS